MTSSIIPTAEISRGGDEGQYPYIATPSGSCFNIKTVLPDMVIPMLR